MVLNKGIEGESFYRLGCRSYREMNTGWKERSKARAVNGPPGRGVRERVFQPSYSVIPGLRCVFVCISLGDMHASINHLGHHHPTSIYSNAGSLSVQSTSPFIGLAEIGSQLTLFASFFPRKSSSLSAVNSGSTFLNAKRTAQYPRP
jgi:hypothetical protein